MAATLAAAALAATLGAPTEAEADRRIFAYTYPYMTLPQGGFEIEHYLDAWFDRMDDPATVDDPTTPQVENLENDFEVSWRHQVEFEYGIIDSLDFGFYNVFHQDYFGKLGYKGVKLRSRYRFAEQGDLFVDPVVYLEVGYFGDMVKFEQRLIFAPMFGNLEIALNLKFEQEIAYGGPETKFKFIFNPTFAVGYHVTEYLAFGVEYFGRMAEVDGPGDEDFVNYLGPTISVAGNHFFWTLTFQPELNDVAGRAAFQARSLFGIVL